MKAKNLLKVADAIEKALTAKKAPVGFNMCEWRASDLEDKTGKGCKTQACIAGWSYLVNGRTLKQLKKADTFDICQEATRFLGLNQFDSNTLFYGNGDIGFRGEATPQMAIATLRLAAVTKRIEWVKPV